VDKRRLLTGQSAFSVATGLVFVAVLAGCAPEHLDLIPHGDVMLTPGGETIKAYVRLPETGAGGLDVMVHSRGIYRREREGHESVAVPVEVIVENRSESVKGGFEPTGAQLVDSEGRRFTLGWPVVARSGSDTTAVPIEPGARRRFHLEFSTDATDDPRDVAPLTLHLVFDYGATEIPATIHFSGYDRTARYRTYYYGGGWYGPYWGGWGPGWGWGWGPYWGF
jgi:hypothetical protein